MTESQSDDTTLARRNLIRGGAVLAGAAGLSAAGAILAPKASAANGGAVLQGQPNAATATTSLSNTAATATLRLSNSNTEAPTLALSTRSSYDEKDTLPTLQPGEFVSTESGPYLGFRDGRGNTATGYLISNYDVDLLPVPLPITPQRLLDTRYFASRIFARASTGSASPFNASGQLLAGAWIDVPIEGVNTDEVLNAGFFNLTAVSPLAAGFLQAYPPGDRPTTSTVNFSKGAVLSNGCFVGVGLYASTFVVRIYANATTHVILDLTGKSVQGPSVPLPPDTAAGAKTARRRGPSSRRIVRVTKRR